MAGFAGGLVVGSTKQSMYTLQEGVCTQTSGETIWLQQGQVLVPYTLGSSLIGHFLPGHQVRLLFSRDGNLLRAYNQSTRQLYSPAFRTLSEKELNTVSIKPTVMCAIPVLGILPGIVLVFGLLGQTVWLPGMRSQFVKTLLLYSVLYFTVTFGAMGLQLWSIVIFGPAITAFLGFRALFRMQNALAAHLSDQVLSVP